MSTQLKSALESCQRAENMLRDVQQMVLAPGPEILARCESELAQIAALLEAVVESKPEAGFARGSAAVNIAIGESLHQIRCAAGKLKTQFEHGSNYCMGLLQVRLGTGYSEQGLPVLTPSESRSSFEG